MRSFANDSSPASRDGRNELRAMLRTLPFFSSRRDRRESTPQRANAAQHRRRPAATATQADTLAPRVLLSGDAVRVVEDGGTLFVFGTACDDAIEITIGDGRFTVVSTGDTAIAGDNESYDDSPLPNVYSDTFDGPLSAIRMSLGDGNDRVAVFGDGPIAIDGDVRVNAGVGDDVLTLQNLRVAGDVRMLLGDGDDFANLLRLNVRGDVRLSGGDGDDLIAASVVRSVGDFVVSGDAGDDQAVLLSVSARDRLGVDGGGGLSGAVLIDVAATDLTVNGGDAFDAVVGLGVTASDDLSIATGGGGDVVVLTGLSVADRGQILTGDGDDTVLLTELTPSDAAGDALGLAGPFLRSLDLLEASDDLLELFDGYSDPSVIADFDLSVGGLLAGLGNPPLEGPTATDVLGAALGHIGYVLAEGLVSAFAPVELNAFRIDLGSGDDRLALLGEQSAASLLVEGGNGLDGLLRNVPAFPNVTATGFEETVDAVTEIPPELTADLLDEIVAFEADILDSIDAIASVPTVPVSAGLPS